MGEEGVIAISRTGQFTLNQAQQILPVLRKITQDYSLCVEEKISRLESIDPKNSDYVIQLEDEINEEIKQWHIKVKKLGGVPKGLWLIDFDCGNGFLCWKYPEPDILYWHGYDEGFTNRVSIEEWQDKLDNEIRPIPSLDVKEPLHNIEI